MEKDILATKVAIIGLGYVGLPLAVAFSHHFHTIGFDINQQRIDDLRTGSDETMEVSEQELFDASGLIFSSNTKDLSEANVYIVTVPTPITSSNQPDLTPLIKASETIAKSLSIGDVVIYESTVYPGATEEVCIPVLERYSNLTFNRDFFAGYSPERINPGDKEHRVCDILKVTSGSTPDIADFVDNLYSTVITAGTHKASSIKVAEAAKVIENTQRDLNIALVNELAIIFNKLDIDTEEVLKAAGTKWNFLPFRPGLVGGHCIGVDPYYLTHKAQSIGYLPEVILAGRRINDNMGKYVVTRLIKAMIRKKLQVVDAKILILGLTFKENCPDLRNTKVVDITKALAEYDVMVDVYDPCACAEQALEEYDIVLTQVPKVDTYDAVILAVSHQKFIELGVEEIRSYLKPDGILYDLKYALAPEDVDLRL
ncbi:MAG: Vi polysaccharide biosynthesis UDP-N-acetylglucosamine C-6 dehydrogenase TviB [Gammaproteobacteria bacterium]|nr:Vi polysaccharide biosynthesis UDP-N-acetylglucosamine C-6 dehydrogenase TviB [Gammaproteobacteria bacterium]